MYLTKGGHQQFDEAEASIHSLEYPRKIPKDAHHAVYATL
jgi:hypothetical protein